MQTHIYTLAGRKSLGRENAWHLDDEHGQEKQGHAYKHQLHVRNRKSESSFITE
jgi:hypothetical protein